MSTRLTVRHRDTLTALARRIVDVPAEAKIEEAAYQKAAPLVRALVEAEYPPAEMKILAKYEVSRRDKCINVQSEGGDVERFKFRMSTANSPSENWDDEADDSHPLVPDRGGCRNRIYIASAKTWAAVNAWTKAFAVKEKALKEKLDKYLAFISVATTYEQILETWPEAIEVADSITRNLPSTVNPEMLAEIKADSARRMKKAA